MLYSSDRALIQIIPVFVFQFEVSVNPARVKMAAHVTMWVLGMSARALLVLKEARVKVRKNEAILLQEPLR